MPDVGVLNLQIQENSERAVSGLDKIADALTRVKNAVSGGLKLTSVANGIERLGKIVNENISGSTIAKIEQITEALSNLRGLENVNIRITGRDTFDDIRDSVTETVNAVGGIDTGFETVGERIVDAGRDVEHFNDAIRNTNQLMQNTNWTGGFEQFKQMLNSYLYMRSAMALGPGTQMTPTSEETGWVEWKNGAIEVEGYVSEVHDAIEGVADVPKLNSGVEVFEDIRDAAMAAGIPVEEARRSIQETRDSISAPTGATFYNTIEEAAQALGISVEEARRQLGMLEDSAPTGGFSRFFDFSYDEDNALENVCQDAQESARMIDLLREKVSILQDEVNTRMTSSGHFLDAKGLINNRIQIARLTEQIQKLEDAERGATAGTRSFSDRLRDLGHAVRETKMGRLLSQFARIAKYRFLRSVLRHITSGFSEGVENVYNYSKAIGSSFAPAMDSAATSLQQMKNSVGAAVAPAIQALIPLMQTVVNWFITAVNYVNQFFSLLRGQSTWTRALPAATTAFNKQEKAAKNAGNAIKDLLADWDELNIIQSQTSGAGSGAGTSDAEDYLKMFEEVSTFDNTVKDVVGFLKDNFDTLKQAAIDIGLAIMGWKISNAFGGVLGTLGMLAGAVATIAITLRLTDAFGHQFANTGGAGWFIADVLTGAIGATLAGQIAQRLIGGQAGVVTAGFTLILEGAVDLKNSRSAYAQEFTARGQMLAILGSVRAGIGAALIAAGFSASVPMAIAIASATAAITYAINALMAVNITGIKWGEETLSADDVKTFVKQEMLTIDVEAQIEITHAQITLAEEAQTNLSQQATALLQPVHALKLGVNVDDSLTQIKKDVFDDGGLISRFKEFVSAQTGVVNAAETYVPTINENGENISKELLNDSNGAWSELNKLMDELGADLSRHLARAMDKTLSEEMRQFEMNAVSEITDTMIRVSLAGRRASSSSDALASLKFDLVSASKGTYEDILNTYEEFKENLTKENMDLKKAEAASFASAAAQYQEYANDALKKAGGDETDEMYQYYQKKAEHFATRYNEIMENLTASVKTSVDEAVAPGKELVQQAIATMLAGAQEVRDGTVELFTGGKIRGLPTKWAGAIKDNTDDAMRYLWRIAGRDGVTNDNAAELEKAYKDVLDAILKDFFPDDYSMFKRMIDLGLVNYDTFFDPDALFDYMEKVRKLPTDLYRELWDRMFGETKNTSGARVLGHLASNGVSDVGYTRKSETYVAPSGQTTTEQTQALSNGVKSGMKGMQDDQRILLNALISLVTKISNKDFTISITPNSDWGRHNAKSNNEYETVIGG